MRITQVINPEIVLNKRGPKQQLDFYRMGFRFIKGVGAIGEEVGLGLVADEPLYLLDDNSREHLALTFKYRQVRPKNYYVGREFLKAISEVQSDIPTDLLPERFFAYFAFPPGVIKDEEGDVIVGGYTWIGPANETVLYPEDNQGQTLWFSWVYESKSYHGEPITILTGGALKAIDSAGSIKDVFEALRPLQQDGKAHDKTILLFVNLILAVTRADLELIPTRPASTMTNSERKRSREKLGVTNGCEIPLILLSWNFHRARTFHVDETNVRLHWRRQRCGIGKQDERLILINEHIRKFKNVSPVLTAEAPSESRTT